MTPTESDRWHVRWSSFAAACAVLAVFLPIPMWAWDGIKPSTTVMNWEIYWKWGWSPRPIVYAQSAMLVLAAVALSSRHWPPHRRGWLLVVTTVGAAALSLDGLPVRARAGSVLGVAAFVLLCGSAACAHGAHRHGALLRFRVPILLCGAFLSIVAVFAAPTAIMLGNPMSELEGAASAACIGFAGLLGLTQMVCTGIGRPAAFVILRWLARATLAALPLATVLLWALADWSPEDGHVVVGMLKTSLWAMTFLMALSLGIANAMEPAARVRALRDRVPDEVFA